MALRRLGGGADFLVFGMVTITVATVVWTLAGFPFLSWDAESGQKTEPSASPSVAWVDWTFEGRRCADGWPSQSIGQRGACSHHGGVVSVWMSPDGHEAVCRSGTPPLTEEALADQLERHGQVVC